MNTQQHVNGCNIYCSVAVTPVHVQLLFNKPPAHINHPCSGRWWSATRCWSQTWYDATSVWCHGIIPCLACLFSRQQQ